VFIPQPLRSKPVPFDHADWIFELKYDGFRAVAHVDNGRCKLVSRDGTTFASFSVLASSIASTLLDGRAILDGEIVCLDSDGIMSVSVRRVLGSRSRTGIIRRGKDERNYSIEKKPFQSLFLPGGTRAA
jgi:hypothetical protein